MAVFQYRAMAPSGRNVKGIIDADSAAAARRKLREQQLYPTELKETSAVAEEAVEARGLSYIRQRDVAIMTRQLAVLIEAGMPLVEALTALIDQISNARLRRTVYEVRDKVNEGARLADALTCAPRVFNELYVNMVGAGEASGALEQVLFRLADILERQVRLKKRVQASMAYPVVMAIVGIAVIVFLMTVIVPKIAIMFKAQGRELPTITQILITVCNFISERWWLLVLAVLGVLLLWRAWVARPSGRRKWDRFKLAVPLLGGLYLKLICGRMARTMGTMLESGLTMMTALDVVKSVVQNRVVEEIMDDVKSQVRRGQDIAVPLKEAQLFPPMLIHMVGLGQRSGQLETMLLKVADTYDEDVELTVEALVSLLEPLMIIVMGLFVGFMVLAILLPIFDMGSRV